MKPSLTPFHSAGTSAQQSAIDFCNQLKGVPQFNAFDLDGFFAACEGTLARVVARDRYAASMLGPLYNAYTDLAGDLTSKQISMSAFAKGPVRSPHKLRYLMDLLLGDREKRTYCEVGFGAGERSMLALSARPDVAVHSFEATEDPATIPAHDFIDARHTDRLTLYLGDPSITLPRLIAV